MRPLLQSDVPLARFNTFGIDARARWFARVESADDLDALRALPLWRDVPRFVLGGGSNVLFTRDFDGLVVQLATKGVRHIGSDGDDELVAAEAGEDWDAFVRATVEAGWPGLENLALIPGSVGASPVQNIGAYGIELAERFAWLEALDLDSGATRRMDAADCAFGYRDSVFKREARGRTAITRVVFRLPKRWAPRRDYADVRARLAADGIDDPTPRDLLDIVTATRRAKLPDPRVVGNAGSFFKNPLVAADAFEALRARDPAIVGYPEPDGRVKVAAGWMIDRLGWRGRGLAHDARAAVDERQALVLVNRGGASGADVLALAAAIRDDVAARFGIALEPEPVFV